MDKGKNKVVEFRCRWILFALQGSLANFEEWVLLGRLENGESIEVTRVKGIPNYPSNKILHPVHGMEEGWRVSDIIDWDLHGWKRDIIMAKFNRDEDDAICRIPLSQRVVEDSMVLRKDGWAKSSNRSGWQQMWSTLWKLKILGKIKIFGWRACHDILPTWMNLAKRKIVPENLCHCCQREPKDAVHAIWGCGAAQDVWAGSLNVLQKFQTNQFDFMQLFETLEDRLSTTEMELFLVQAWLIWNQRNMVVHGGHMKDPRWLNNRELNC
ncbi:uncharacterized protein LOC142625150 [Castanea sativa]|uniref:uncharacterized protein LOC142625150 n=1 Tax=Castanea sativa TaxID=21020 RepID=UPI003F64FAA4